MPDDADLLRDYAENGSEAAFAALVQRRIDLVYSLALRQCGGDAHLAQDAVQRVFADLARKARTVARHPVVTGWLLRSAWFAASDLVRTERRRRAREQEAQTMSELVNERAGDAEWEQFRPVLDGALHELGERDRDAIALRFFEGRAFAEIGATLRLSEDAARMRVDRALEKLRGRLARRGVTSTAAALGLALANQAGVAAPAGLATSVASAAVAGAATAGGLGAVATLFAMSKIKIGIVGAIVLASLSTAVVELRANRALRAELASMSGALEEDGVLRLQRENGQLSKQVAVAAAKNPEVDELTHVRNRIAALKARPDGVVDEEIRAPRNLGRATPAAAMETFCWAIDQKDLDLVAPFIRFTDDTPENRAAFMANFSAAVRDRYRTPERLCAEAFFGVDQPNSDPSVAVQVVSVREDHGADQVDVRIWWRTASGKEAGGGSRMWQFADGWAMKPIALRNEKEIAGVKARFDPATGDVIPFDAEKR